MNILAFGEQYQGMSDREILIEVATRQATLEDKVDHIKCPSPRCQDHENRLNTIETTEANRKDSGASVIAWVGIVIAIVSAMVATYVAVKGG
ncbi:MAG TPA: hypothetical protein VLH13_00680 [Methanomassiliicoccales archaeon]|nr:hypothetical protein [Methanomassiliicoccales archaeon]